MSYTIAFCIFLGIYFTAIIIEALYSHLFNKGLYERRDSFVNIVLGTAGILIKLSIKGAWLMLWLFLYQFSLFKIPETVWSWVILFLLNEFLYYWFHRLSHEKRWLWAIHVNHHSSEKLNFTTAARIPLFSHLVHIIFWISLVLIGFNPVMIFTIENFGFLFAVIQHTQVIKKTPLLDLVFNTPSHHRVHHSSNEEYLNKNYGNVLIIFDRLFGTFKNERDDVAIKFGITKNIRSYNLLKVIFHEWGDMLRQNRSETNKLQSSHAKDG
jgi:sterol desaturase/sphingolipid hydroxylase (fatty acid hydroxylase superfamily)